MYDVTEFVNISEDICDLKLVKVEFIYYDRGIWLIVDEENNKEVAFAVKSNRTGLWYYSDKNLYNDGSMRRKDLAGDVVREYRKKNNGV